MSLIDDLKNELKKTSIKKDEIEKVITVLTNKYGGSKWYVRRRKLGLTFKN